MKLRINTKTRYEWYSNTDSIHFKQKVAYMMNDPLYLNDVKRHQKIAESFKKTFDGT